MPSGTAGGIDVLHVDDEPGFVEVAAELLERRSDRITVHTETDPGAALERVTEEGSPIDCVVSDYEMPGMDGLELLTAVRRERPGLPFVLFTGAGSEELASDAISAGVDDYVRKGSGSGQYALLANRIENAVDQHRDASEAERARRRFRTLVEESSDVVTVLDEEGVFEYVAPSAERVLGYTPEEMVGTASFEYVHPEDRERTEEAFDRIVDGEESITVVFRVHKADGDVCWLEARGRDHRDDDLIGGVVVHVRDVTDRKQREERLRGTLELSKDVVTVLDDDGTIRYQSPSVGQVLGYDPEEMVGDPAFEYVHPEDREWVQRNFAAMLQEGNEAPERIEMRFRHADGSWRWLETLGSAREDPAVDGYVVNSRDVTEAKERERTLERYREVVETAGDAMFALDADGTLRMVNDAFVELSGISKEDLVGAHGREYMTEEDFRKGTEELLAVMEDEEKFRGRFEFTGGDYPASDRHFETIITPLTEDDRLVGSVGVIRDVTERKRYERELERKNERLRTIVDNVPVVLFALDGDGTFTLSEGRALANRGLEPGEAVGASVFEMYADQPAVLEDARQALDGERVHGTYELGDRAYETWYEPVVRDGTVERVVGVAIDVTERRERERELERQNERLDQFASLVSHDLRNPLEVATAEVEFARRSCDCEPVEGIADALDRMADIVDDLTTLARESEGVDDTEQVPVPEVATVSWDGIDAPAVDLELEDAVVEADRSKLRRLLENLLRNSVEHSSTGDRPGADHSAEHGSTGDPSGTDAEDAQGSRLSTVRVGPLYDGETDEQVGFFVEDDGPGIDPEDRDRDSVFEPGYSTGGEGSGFGLFIVREVARAHDWTVEAAESASGGARFEVRTDGAR